MLTEVPLQKKTSSRTKPEAQKTESPTQNKSNVQCKLHLSRNTCNTNALFYHMHPLEHAQRKTLHFQTQASASGLPKTTSVMSAPT